MNLIKLINLSASLKPSASNPTLTLTILDNLLHQCRSSNHFNQIVSQTITTGFLAADTFAAGKLLMFSTNSPFISLTHSHRIFTHIRDPNAFIYNTMMRALLTRNQPEKALLVYKMMRDDDNVGPDTYTYPLLLQSCSQRLSEFEGRLIHGHVVKVGFDSDVYVQNTLINLYSVCLKLSDARQVFDESPVLDLVSWNSMLAGYVAVENVDEAKSIFETMPKRNVIASNSMIVLFGKCRNVDDARKVFDEMADRDMVSWSALISCYLQNQMHEEALKKFKEMTFNGVVVDEIVLISALSASAHSLDVNTGRLIHSLAIKVGIDLYVNLQNALIHMYSVCGELVSAEKLFSHGCCLDLISWNSMISGYLKCREINKARSLFNSMPRKDIVSWSVMISGYAQLDRFADALALFQDMFQDLQKNDGIQPDETVLVSAISACTHLSAIDLGTWIHAYIKKKNLKINVILGTTLIDMHMKFGSVQKAMEVFDQMEEKGVSSWNALILGLAMNGLVKESLETFSEMEERGVVANEVTFLAVLGACRHVGLVEEGRGLFELMTEKYKIEPSVKHYGCMVDLLGRAGKLREAEELIATMPMAPDVSTWGALLGACNKHEDDVMGERVGRKLIGLRPEHDGFHVMLSNIYASRGDWDGVDDVRGTMRKNKVTKVPGCSMIEVNGIVHEFFAGENRQHSQIDEIDEMLEEMANRLKMEGYAADKDNEESEDMQ